MKTTNKLSKWCKRTLMLLPAVAMLTIMSCQKDGFLPDAVTDTDASPHATSLARASVAGSYVITFESAQGYLAGPTEEGENCYEGYDSSSPNYDPNYPRYYYYYDTATGLYMGLNPDAYDPTQYNMWGGGICISRWNNMATAGWTNQCSVYYDDGNGGYDGSETFAFHYGYKDESGYGVDARSYISFRDTSKRCTFNSFYVTNNTYAVLSMEYGDSFATRPLDEAHQDWFRLVIDGLDGNGVVTASDTVYLADFRTSSGAPGIIKDWTYVDLSPLGSVNALRFDMQGSLDNGYGLATPAYFCFDDLTVTLP
jgi:hypothetical protein